MSGVGLLYRIEEGERKKEYLVYEAIYSLENLTLKMSAIMPSPSYLGHLGRCNTNRSDSTCVTPPKVAKVSREGKIASKNVTAHFEKCKQLCEYEHLFLLRDIWL